MTIKLPYYLISLLVPSTISLIYSNSSVKKQKHMRHLYLPIISLLHPEQIDFRFISTFQLHLTVFNPLTSPLLSS